PTDAVAEGPFEEDEDFEDDTWIEPAQLMAQMLGAVADRQPASSVGQTGLADHDEVDLQDVNVPAADEMGRGKRRRTANRMFDGFVGH
ncbi:uncharacterized protein STEHIDRAFT_161050, partial [Stereum hirsutum FP-91666 SS1]|uniref:uncharacterized protein n=1 Tax=Stereum hirsutum (strain FP-91666) TaxID=721885 RepID=UPI00044499C6